MTEQPSAIPPARVRPASNWSAIWILPLIALLIGSWLGWKAYDQRGVMIDIRFTSGDGIAAGKTELIYKGMSLGKVQTVDLSEDKQSVLVHIEVNRSAEDFLRKDSRFWLVQPRVSLAGVTGLETLVSGNYITFEPGQGKKTSHYTALVEPPPLSDALPGLHIQLKSARLDSLSVGSPVYYRQIQVGQINSYALTEEQDGVLIKVHIKPEFAHLVGTTTRFWNVSGINVSASLSGVKINVESMVSLLAGGISFDNIAIPGETAAADNQTKPVYTLYENFDEAKVGILVQLALHDFSGVQPGVTAVRWRGQQIGVVKGAKVDNDLGGAVAVLSLDPRAVPYITSDTQFWLVKPSITLAGIKGLEALTQGNFIEIKAGSKDAPAKRNFVALAAAPAPDNKEPGLHLKFSTEQVGSISVGAPLLYRQLKVGSVSSITLGHDKQHMIISALVDPKYAGLVNKSSYFWNASGISVSGSLSGIQIKSDSLQSMIEGGIAFATPDQQGKPVGNGYSFNLFSDNAAAIEKGQTIELQVPSGEGLRVGTVLRFKGLEVGRVESLGLNAQRSGVLLQVKVFIAADLIARQGAQFWIVGPELGLMRTANLDTLVSGPYLEVLPPSTASPTARSFVALSKAPAAQAQLKGLRLTLTTAQRGSLKAGVPISYRGMAVGQVSHLELAPNADQVLVHILIEPRFSPLVHRGSRFWNASGINLNVSLFDGAKLRTDSVEALLEGGIAFATPDDAQQGPAALPGQRFALHSESQDEWLHWQPKIKLGQASAGSAP